VGFKQERSCGTCYNTELVVASGHEPRGSQGPTLFALLIGTLHSPAARIAEVNDPLPFQHAAAPFPVTVPVDPKTLAEWSGTGVVHRIGKVIPRFVEFLTSFV
jgi:hypothetical protein